MTVTYGIAVGWPSKNLVILQSLESPLQTGPLTISEASWIGSILCIGGALGSVSFGWLADVIGRKHAVTLICVPSAVSYGKIPLCIVNLQSNSHYRSVGF